MSWASCNDDGCNNIHFNKPPLVSDGRLFTAYDSTSATMEKIRQFENLTSNWEYRKYLQNNAKEIMKYNNIECFYTLGVNPTTLFSEKMNSTPITETNRNKPLYGYCNKNSDLKNYYLSREELNAKMISPYIIMK